MRKPIGARMQKTLHDYGFVNKLTIAQPIQINNLQNITAITMIYCRRFLPMAILPLR
jgi:hypothetical protein